MAYSAPGCVLPFVARVRFILSIYRPQPVTATVTPIHAFLYQAPKPKPHQSQLLDTDTNTVTEHAKQNRSAHQSKPAPSTPQPSQKTRPNHSQIASVNHAAQPSQGSQTTTNQHQSPAPKTPHIRDITARYLQQQQLATVNQLATEQARRQTSRNSFSIMTPEPESLVLPTIAMGERNGSLDAPLDPNRIVKQGDTCYRVVKTPTQLNPDAENLGFGFKCAKTDDEQLLEASLKNRINQHR
ncbi:hypothetical protein KHX94_08815 [Shewanella dokdonensis]|uniref:Uncharacterized protein n=1 Tax=Shewanella dokdonensis TaxID=712036 RepID=A0ABX8DIB7_9GAMM|nr:hypothetical protein [Shewanella dokdonensis]QVK24529.1 hypothetical protein KHX94_08815 [Shewanella dokdonensis]